MPGPVSDSYQGPTDAIERFEKLVASWKDGDAELGECNDIRVAFGLGREAEREAIRQDLEERATRLRCVWHKLAPPEGCSTCNAIGVQRATLHLLTKEL